MSSRWGHSGSSFGAVGAPKYDQDAAWKTTVTVVGDFTRISNIYIYMYIYIYIYVHGSTHTHKLEKYKQN